MPDPKQTKFLLDEAELPKHWYNLNADLEALGVEMAPVLNPQTHEPAGPGDLNALFPEALVGRGDSLPTRRAHVTADDE